MPENDCQYTVMISISKSHQHIHNQSTSERFTRRSPATRTVELRGRDWTARASPSVRLRRTGYVRIGQLASSSRSDKPGRTAPSLGQPHSNLMITEPLHRVRLGRAPFRCILYCNSPPLPSVQLVSRRPRTQARAQAQAQGSRPGGTQVL